MSENQPKNVHLSKTAHAHTESNHGPVILFTCTVMTKRNASDANFHNFLVKVLFMDYVYVYFDLMIELVEQNDINGIKNLQP